MYTALEAVCGSSPQQAPLALQPIVIANAHSRQVYMEERGRVASFSARSHYREDSVRQTAEQFAWESSKRRLCGVSPAMNTTESDVETSTLNRDSEESLRLALSACIRCGAEAQAITLAQKLTSAFPLHLVIRAGETGLLNLLRTLHDLRIPITSDKVVFRLRLRARRYMRQKVYWRPRIVVGSGCVSAEDLLQWACATSRQALAREILACDLHFAPEAVVHSLLSQGWDELITALLRDQKLIVTPEATLCALSFERLQLVWAMSVSCSCLDRREWSNYRVVQRLTELVKQAECVTPALALLARVPLAQWGRFEVDSLILALRGLLSAKDWENHAMANSANPLLLCITACELCKRLEGWNFASSELFSRLAQQFALVASEIQSQCVDYMKLKSLYLETGVDGDCLFDLVTRRAEEYRFLLMNGTVVSIVRNLWRSEGRTSLGLSDHCPFLPFLRQVTNLRSLLTIKLPPASQTESVFQFHIWKHDGLVRYIAETTSLVAMFVLLIYILVLYVKVNLAVRDGIATLEAAEEAQAMVKMLNYFRNAFAGYAYALVLSHLQSLLRLFLLGQPLRIDPRFLFDLLMACDITVVLVAYEQQYFNTTPDDGTLMNECLYGFLFLLAGLRICLILLQTQTFGPILRMIYLIARDISAYLLIYLLTLFSFALLFVVLFWRIWQFQSIWLALRTLFSWSVGGFDPSVFTQRQELGSALGCVWALVSAVLLLNLLVAVLSSRLEQLNPQAKADYVAIVYQSYKQSKYEEEFGALVVAPTPFNCVMLPVAFLYVLFPSWRRTVTKAFAVASHQVMLVVGLAALTVWNAAMLPVTYALAGWKLARLRQNPLVVAVWLLVGPAYLVSLWLLSYPCFVVSMYREPRVPTDISQFRYFTQLKDHIRALLLCGPCLSLSEIAPTLAVFRHSSSIEFAYGQSQFQQTVQRIYTSRREIHRKSFCQCLDFLSQFASAEGRIDLRRALQFMQSTNQYTVLSLNCEMVRQALRKGEKQFA